MDQSDNTGDNVGLIFTCEIPRADSLQGWTEAGEAETKTLTEKKQSEALERWLGEGPKDEPFHGLDLVESSAAARL